MAGEEQLRAVGVLRVADRDGLADVSHLDALSGSAAAAALVPLGTREIQSLHPAPLFVSHLGGESYDERPGSVGAHRHCT